MTPRNYQEARLRMRQWLMTDEPHNISLDLSALSFDEAMDIFARLEAADRWLKERDTVAE